ncbi:hypothetical protein B0T18DRAFT_415815 [Schizothecium vesticola]|uniref:Uncharacterized protein n=1 Tax=Schizothecium vesticola TaxID=314040 RepID=A0AA40K2P7_9PEZI|nr:hypothetical protein B0T18DRAFT_415815 [Schizothecium vesticola]
MSSSNRMFMVSRRLDVPWSCSVPTDPVCPVMRRVRLSRGGFYSQGPAGPGLPHPFLEPLANLFYFRLSPSAKPTRHRRPNARHVWVEKLCGGCALQASMSMSLTTAAQGKNRGCQSTNQHWPALPVRSWRGPACLGLGRETEEVMDVHAASPETRTGVVCGCICICCLGKQVSACCPCLGSRQVPPLAFYPTVRVLGVCDCGCPRRASLPVRGRLAKEDEVESENLRGAEARLCGLQSAR